MKVGRSDSLGNQANRYFQKRYQEMRKAGQRFRRNRIITILAIPKRLEVKNKQHNLHGDFEGWQECHITPDWLLIFRYYDDGLELFRTGSHSELFGN